MQYRATPAFKKDFKKLYKKFKTLEEDFEMAKRNAIELFHQQKINNESVFRIPHVGSEVVQFYKLKKFACRSLKGFGVKSGIRVIYAFYPTEQQVEFIEMYFKGDSENEDKNRIKAYLEER